jgi:hypothetical protein
MRYQHADHTNTHPSAIDGHTHHSAGVVDMIAIHISVRADVTAGNP